TVTGVDDSLVDGDIGYMLVTGAATSADPNYNGLDAADVPLANVDDDAPGAPAPGNGGPPAPAGTVGGFRPATPTWYLRHTRNTGAPGLAPVADGSPGWMAVVGDWDGDGTDTIGVFDPRTATFYLRNSNSAGAPDAGIIHYGAPGWLPVVGDWDGDGT